MKVITGLDFAIKNSSVSLGKFDGIHLGHRFLLSRIMNQKEYIPTVFTFEMNADSPKIYTQKEKDFILEELGVAREVIFPFHEKTRNMTPEEFIKEVLVRRMDAKHICVGEDFRFGKDRQGDVHTLQMYQKEYGYQLEIIKKLTYDNEIISSTRVRELMDEGDIATVNRLLGKPYFIAGKVVHGNELGRTMEMPTANIIPESGKKLLPFGVYATTVLVDGKEYFGVTNIGRKPTIGEFSAGVETNIMDFEGNLYDREIKVVFYEFLRPEKKFDNTEQLRKQMENDREKAYQVLARMDIPARNY